MMSRAAQASIATTGGITGDTSQTAVASSITPKPFLTPSIHGPVFGSSEPPAVPTAISGTPMPSAMTNSAVPPSTASPVWPI